MDRSQIIEALRLAKSVVMSHGIVEYMSDYNRKTLSGDIQPGAVAIRFDFHLFPKESIWSAKNPGCGFTVGYAADKQGTYTVEDGSIALDNNLSISCRTSGDDLPLETMRKRESLIDQLMMLCSMLETVLSSKIVITTETAEAVKERVQKELEQSVGIAIHDALGMNAFKGLRKGGNGKYFRIPDNYATASGSMPAAGFYRYVHVRRRNSRGAAIDTAKYTIKVFSNGNQCVVARVD